MTREEKILEEVRNRHSLGMYGLEDWKELPIPYKDRISEIIINEYANRRVQEYQKWLGNAKGISGKSSSGLLEMFNSYMQETI